MPLLMGVQPGGRGSFAVAALYHNGRLPVTLLQVRSFSGVDEVLGDILGVCGEWDALSAVAVAAPLSWSGSPSGWRKCDRQLLAALPTWAPKSWLRAPNALPGAVSVQGPALVWALAKEAKGGVLPAHAVIETMPRLCLMQLASEQREAVLGYYNREVAVPTRRTQVAALMDVLTEPGILTVGEVEVATADALDAVVCGLVALAVADPDMGLIVSEHQGGDIRPVGRRHIAVLRAFP